MHCTPEARQPVGKPDGELTQTNCLRLLSTAEILQSSRSMSFAKSTNQKVRGIAWSDIAA